MKYFVKEGERYSRLVVKATHQRVNGKPQFYNLCLCDCGNTTYRTSNQLVRGLMKSCGCGYRERLERGNFVHGGAARRNGKSDLSYLYGLWLRIRSHCHNPADPVYPRWGGKGISVIPGWRGSYPAFQEWIAGNLGPRPSLHHRLERLNRSQGFQPGNLFWLGKNSSK